MKLNCAPKQVEILWRSCHYYHIWILKTRTSTLNLKSENQCLDLRKKSWQLHCQIKISLKYVWNDTTNLLPLLKQCVGERRLPVTQHAGKLAPYLPVVTIWNSRVINGWNAAHKNIHMMKFMAYIKACLTWKMTM